MRRGGFPGQEEAVRAFLAEARAERGRASRRAALGMIAGAVAGVAGGGAAVSWLRRDRFADAEPTAARVPTAEVPWATDWATRPIESLWRSKGTTLVRLAAVEGELGNEVWMGVARLIERAVDGSARDRLELSSLLRGFLARKPPPDHLLPWVDLLRRG